MGEVQKPILAVDFDGVIHSYSSGWQGAHVANDEPVPGSIEFLRSAIEHFTVCIYSSRSKEAAGVEAMQQYIAKHAKKVLPDFNPAWLLQLQYPKHRPPAFLTIDDRAYLFTGVFPDPKSLLGFKPWNKR